jgi:P27 family predicted phage terminase small subunit
MPTGRKAVPTAIKIANGNPGKRALNMDEPNPDKIVDIENPPPALSKDAKKVWPQLARILDEAKILTVADSAALCEYCECYARLEAAKKLYHEKGMYIDTPMGGVVLAPWYRAIQMETRNLMHIAAEFGMTPASRTKVKKRDSGKSDNPFLKLMPRTQ